MKERLSFADIPSYLKALEPDEATELVEQRLRRRPTPVLGGVGRGDDPSDLFVELFNEYPAEVGPPLERACLTLLDQWARWKDAQLVRTPQPLGDLIFLCTRLKARDAIPQIAQIANRSALASAQLPGNEDLQNRALRALGGLLIGESDDSRRKYRPLFEAALERRTHAAVGLTALSYFWPPEKRKFISQAQQHKDSHLDTLVEHLDAVLETFTED